MFDHQSKGGAVLKQHKKQESLYSKDIIDRTISSAELLSDKLKFIGNDLGGTITSALKSLSDPFKVYAKQPVPLRRVQNGEFVGFITGNIIFDL